MSYNIEYMPTNLEEWNQLITHYTITDPGKTREEWERHFRAAGYYPQELTPIAQPVYSLAELKEQKHSVLKAAFEQACETAVTTVDGMVINSNATAYRNIDGLIKKLQAEMLEDATLGENGEVMVHKDPSNVMFCDAANNFHEVSFEQLNTMQLAIIDKGNELYARKWQLREVINTASDEAALNEIEISFPA